jgi:DoxX-like family
VDRLANVSIRHTTETLGVCYANRHSDRKVVEIRHMDRPHYQRTDGCVPDADAVPKILRVSAVVKATVQAGYPESLVAPIGITLLICVAFYVIPRTSVLGAILLTGYLGGATATMVRIQSPWFLFPVVFGMLAWAGLFLRDNQLRALIPLKINLD